jgi:hypothetical protein
MFPTPACTAGTHATVKSYQQHSNVTAAPASSISCSITHPAP